MVHYMLPDDLEKKKKVLVELDKDINSCSEKLNTNLKVMNDLEESRNNLNEKIIKIKAEVECSLSNLDDLNLKKKKMSDMIESCCLIGVITVDDGRNRELSNGLVDVKRDIVMRLVRLMKNKKKIRSIIGLSKTFYEWSKHQSFRSATRIPKKLHPDEKNKQYCICRLIDTPDERMIECDNCFEWYHYKCVGLTPEKTMHLEKWICERCKYQRKPLAKKDIRKEVIVHVVKMLEEAIVKSLNYLNQQIEDRNIGAVEAAAAMEKVRTLSALAGDAAGLRRIAADIELELYTEYESEKTKSYRDQDKQIKMMLDGPNNLYRLQVLGELNGTDMARVNI